MFVRASGFNWLHDQQATCDSPAVVKTESAMRKIQNRSCVLLIQPASTLLLSCSLFFFHFGGMFLWHLFTYWKSQMFNFNNNTPFLISTFYNFWNIKLFYILTPFSPQMSFLALLWPVKVFYITWKTLKIQFLPLWLSLLSLSLSAFLLFLSYLSALLSVFSGLY